MVEDFSFLLFNLQTAIYQVGITGILVCLVKTELSKFKFVVDRNIGFKRKFLVSNFVRIRFNINLIFDVKLEMYVSKFWLIFRMLVSFVVEQEKSCLVTAE